MFLSVITIKERSGAARLWIILACGWLLLLAFGWFLIAAGGPGSLAWLVFILPAYGWSWLAPQLVAAIERIAGGEE